MKTSMISAIFCAASVALTGCRCSEQPGHRQIPFLHGQLQDARIVNGQIVASNSWSRGDGAFSLNLKDPEHPVPVGGVPAAGYISMSAMSGSFLYYNTGYSIMVVDVSKDPSKPPVLRENHPVEFPVGSIRQLQVSGEKLYAYCADGLRIYDISNPGRLELEKFDTSLSGKILSVSGKLWRADKKTLYAPDGTKQDFPQQISALYEYAGKPLVLLGNGTLTDASGKTILTNLSMFDVDGDIIKYRTKKEAKLYRVRKGLEAKEEVYELPPEIGDSRIHSTGDLMVALRNMQITLLRLKNGKAEVLSRIPVVYNEGSISVSDGKAYCTSYQSTGCFLYGLDLRHPQKNGRPYDFAFQLPLKPENRWDFHLMIPASAVYATGRYLFMPGALLDIKPETPAVLADTGRSASAIHRDGDRVLMAQGSYARIYDVSNLPNLKLVCEIKKEKSDIMDILPAGKGKVFVLERNQLSVYDIANPAAPKSLAALPLDGQAYCMAQLRTEQHGTLLYLFPGRGAKDAVLRIVSVKDLAKPVLLKTIPKIAEETVCQVIQYKDTFIIPDGDLLKQYDVKTDPLNPKLVRTFSSADCGMRSYSFLTVDGKTLVGKKYSRLDVWDDLELPEPSASVKGKGN